MKNKTATWIVGIGGRERKYKVGDVTYTVASNFEPFKSLSNLKERLARTLVSVFVPLTIIDTENKMADEYVCSTAGEEDNNAVEKEN